MKCAESKTYTKDNTPYADVGKTMLHGCPAFMIPIVNEIFSENYSMTDSVELFSEGHYLQENEEHINKGYKDSYFRIKGEKSGKYHIEVQSYEDNTIIHWMSFLRKDYGICCHFICSVIRMIFKR